MNLALGLLRLIVVLGAVGLGLATVCALAARLWWAFDLFSHFRVQYAVLAALLGVVALALRAWPAAAGLVAVGLIHGFAIKDLWLAPGPPGGLAGVPLRLASANVLRSNPTPEKVQEFILASDADLVVLVETEEERWSDVLAAIGARYPHQAPRDWQDGAPVVLFSRYPVIRDSVIQPPGGQRPYLLVDLEVADHTLTVLGVHPSSPSPRDPSDTRERNRALDHMAENLEGDGWPALVTGDFNTSYWSPHFQDLLEVANLRNAAEGHGYVPTWPKWFWPARIPIDHVLLKGPIVAEAVGRGPATGSDHFPIVADLRLLEGQ